MGYTNYALLSLQELQNLAKERDINIPSGSDILTYVQALNAYDDRYDKILGMLYGVALGDALGAPHEFKTSIPVTKYTGELVYQLAVPSRFQGTRKGVIGQVSDDTEMTLALAKSIIENNGYNRDQVILAYEDWANSKPMMGKNTRRLFQGVKTIKGYEQRYNKALQEDLEEVQSNGSLMRASPLAIFINLDDLDSFSPVVTDTRLTNPNRINEEASLIYTSAIAMALEGETADNILNAIAESKEQYAPEIEEAIDQAMAGTIRNVKENKGWVVHALYAALLGLSYYDTLVKDIQVEAPFSESLNQIIILGGDTDTNGAIAGGLLGAYIGYDTMQKEAVTKQNIEIINATKTEEADFPRPEEYHPRNIPEIARQLSIL